MDAVWREAPSVGQIENMMHDERLGVGFRLDQSRPECSCHRMRMYRCGQFRGVRAKEYINIRNEIDEKSE